MRTLLLHGETGGWDELVIALAAFGVLWIAVKLAGRKTATADQDDSTASATPGGSSSAPVDDEHRDPSHPPVSKLG